MECLYCGKFYKIGFKQTSKFCSPSCRLKYIHNKNKIPKPCLICGKELTGYQKLYCSSECRQIAKKTKQMEFN